MSFAGGVKEELCEAPFQDVSCQSAELYAMLLFGRSLDRKNYLFQTESRHIANRFIDLMIDQFEVIVTVIKSRSEKRRGITVYTLTIDNPQEQQQIKQSVHVGGRAGIAPEFCDSDASKAAFVRGAFISCGSIVDPQKEYHLEFVLPNKQLSDDLALLLATLAIEVKPVQRKGSDVLYLKESEQIEDLLTRMGATKSSLEIMNIKIYKNMRNKVNRVTNCETANIEKTVMASAQQVEDIQRIIQKKGLDYLPDNLKEIAILRLKNPELSLSELAELFHHTISRSGINHRLKRISEIAAQLETTN